MKLIFDQEINRLVISLPLNTALMKEKIIPSKYQFHHP